MAGRYNRRELHKIMRNLERQGATIVPGKSGSVIRFPDGSTTNVHYSSSDSTAWRAIRERVRKAGLQWPGDPHRPKTERTP